MKKIVCDIRQLTGEHRRAIERAAGARGYAVCFPGSAAEALTEARDAEILFTADTRLVKAAAQLRWLCVPSAGVEPYLPDALYANPGALLTNSSGAYGVTISEHVIMVTLEMMRRRADYARIVSERRWQRLLPMRSIRDCRATLLGTGDIGREVAKRLRAFGPASVTGVSRRGLDPEGLFDRALKVDALDDVLPETDLLILSLPGTPDTANLMDGRRLKLLPEGAYLVNVGRGSALDQAALIALLRAGRLAGAALDVFREEPLPPDDAAWDCPRLLITPHIAGDMALPYTVDRIADMFLEDFENHCAGRPLKRQVDRKRGY